MGEQKGSACMCLLSPVRWLLVLLMAPSVAAQCNPGSFRCSSASMSSPYWTIGNYILAATPIQYSCSSGTISSAPYYNCDQMQATIAPLGATSVTLSFLQFSTESGFDFLSVYQCASASSCSTSGTRLLRTSGASIPSAVTSSTGAMLLQWCSDS